MFILIKSMTGRPYRNEEGKVVTFVSSETAHTVGAMIPGGYEVLELTRPM